MALTDMKRSKKEKKGEDMCCHVGGDDYPWGLRIDLNNDAMTKLGLKVKDFASGDKVLLSAECKVVGTRTNDVDGKEEQHMELQIVKMEVDGSAKTSKGVKRMAAKDSGPGGMAE